MMQVCAQTPIATGAADKAATIRQLNDQFRRRFIGGKVMLTAGVNSLPVDKMLALTIAVKQFDAFNSDNDPYEEHDFGAVEVGGACFFWKIDHYDVDLQFGSPDPNDESVTCRVLTIMRADEY
ncbi:DUF3768 domain-containing protein [Rhizobium sp. BK060]|uniref:DUF3768 domain-containing protein n=1 Tax=Rhizobium sp. BK060 TaxID=2587096 RepID=UPI0017E68E49|nr:DUF3768 domain-containing protein [Rhizobium sp. BK060]MBB3399707.1 hypothetical protein [Rhizobium sp. BK060]